MTINETDLDNILDRFQGEPIRSDAFTSYQKTAMQFFHDEAFVINPYLSITTQLNLTSARAIYDHYYGKVAGSSFHIYLTWNLARALKEEKCFSTRKIGDTWYQFDNLPLYFPIIADEDTRFKDVFIYDVLNCDWERFVRQYRESIEASACQLGAVDQWTWSIANFIGNLPYLNFTAFSLHRITKKVGRPIFYFGQRTSGNDQCVVPLSITIDHANADPYAVDLLIKRFFRLLSSVPEYSSEEVKRLI